MTLQGSKALSKHQLVVSPSMCVNSLNSALALEIAEGRRGELSPDILLWKLRKFLPWGTTEVLLLQYVFFPRLDLFDWLAPNVPVCSPALPREKPSSRGVCALCPPVSWTASLPGSPADSSASCLGLACRSHILFHLTCIAGCPAEGFENREKPKMLK